jgi:hypothetical protein
MHHIMRSHPSLPPLRPWNDDRKHLQLPLVLRPIRLVCLSIIRFDQGMPIVKYLLYDPIH